MGEDGGDRAKLLEVRAAAFRAEEAVGVTSRLAHPIVLGFPIVSR